MQIYYEKSLSSSQRSNRGYFIRLFSYLLYNSFLRYFPNIIDEFLIWNILIKYFFICIFSVHNFETENFLSPSHCLKHIIPWVWSERGKRAPVSMIYSDGGHQALSSSLILTGHADTRRPSQTTTQTSHQPQDISVEIFYLCVGVGAIYLPLLWQK